VTLLVNTWRPKSESVPGPLERRGRFAQIAWDTQRPIDWLALKITQAVRRDDKTED
jgi:hypothetical protein